MLLVCNNLVLTIQYLRYNPLFLIFTNLFLFLVFSSALTQIMEVMTGPMMQSLENRLEHNKSRILALEDEKQKLLQELDSQRKSDVNT